MQLKKISVSARLRGRFTLETEEIKLAESIYQLQQSISALESENADLERQLDTLSGSEHGSNQDINKLENRLATLELTHSNLIKSNLVAAIKALKKENLEKLITHIGQHITSTAEELLQVENQIAELRNQHNLLRQSMSELELLIQDIDPSDEREFEQLCGRLPEIDKFERQLASHYRRLRIKPFSTP